MRRKAGFQEMRRLCEKGNLFKNTYIFEMDGLTVLFPSSFPAMEDFVQVPDQGTLYKACLKLFGRDKNILMREFVTVDGELLAMDHTGDVCKPRFL